MPDWPPKQGGAPTPPAWSELPRPAPRFNVLLLLGVVVLVGAIAAAGYLLTRSGQVPATAGEPRATPTPRITPTPRATPTVASPRPTTPAPTATPRPSATADPVVSPPPEARAAIDRFLEAMGDGDASYHLEGSGSLVAGGQEMTMSFSFDVAGSDLSTTMSFGDERRHIAMRMVIKNEFAYVKVDDGNWLRAPRPETAFDPFDRVVPESYADVRYLGTVERERRTLYHVRVPVSVPLHLVDGMETLGCEADDLRMDFWIGGNGVPASAEYAMECDVKYAGRRLTSSALVEYDFSRFGERIRIKPPQRFRNG